MLPEPVPCLRSGLPSGAEGILVHLHLMMVQSLCAGGTGDLSDLPIDDVLVYDQRPIYYLSTSVWCKYVSINLTNYGLVMMYLSK